MRQTFSTIAQALISSSASGLQGGWELDELLEEMAPSVEDCVQPTAGPGVFTLCWDLHSSIHAHWAAYRLARANPALDYLATTSHTALEYWKVRLHWQTGMDYVYAKAWFLLLALEYEKWCLETGARDPLRLAPIATDVADSLLVHYQGSPPHPNVQEYNNPSWVILQMHRWFEYRADAAGLAETRQLIDDHFMISSPALFFGWDVNTNQGFFSVYANWIHLIVETQPFDTAQAWLQLQYDPPDAHLAVTPASTPHSYGLIWSRVWGLRSLARIALTPGDRQRFWRASEQHVGVGMDRHAQLSQNFFAYGHWVPQFVSYAVTEGMGF